MLARLAYDFAHIETLSEITTELVRDFLDHYWSESAPATRRNRLAIVKSFFTWAVKERELGESPAAKIKPPKRANVERQAYTPETIDQLVRAQPSLRDQIAIQLLGRLALRKNELRLMKVKDVDLGRGTIRIHGKGGKVVVLPIGSLTSRPTSRFTSSAAIPRNICSTRKRIRRGRWTPPQCTDGSNAP